MTVHTLVIAGGQGRRLQESAPQSARLLPRKPLIEAVGQPGSPRLIDTVVGAVRHALLPSESTVFLSDARLVAVGPPMDLPAGVECVREDPPLSGPASAIAAGVRALSDESAQDLSLIHI